MANILQVLIDIKSRLEGLDEATAKMQVLRAETEKVTVAGQERAGILGSFAQQEAERAAALTQQVAIESQLQVIAGTKADLAAAQIKGDEAQVGLLSAELKIRTSTLGVMRSEVLTAAQLNALTEEESALLSIAAFRSNEVTAGSLLAGASLNKAKGEAVTLAREMATGSVNARTIGALLGSLGNTLTIAGVAAFALFQIVSHVADEIVRLATENEKQSDELLKQVGHWNELAKAAANFADVVKLGENIQPELDKLSAKLAEFRNKEIGVLGTVFDAITKTFGSAIPGRGPTFSQTALDTARAEAEQRVKDAFRVGIAERDAAQTAVDAWAKVKLEPLNDAIAKQTSLVKGAQNEYALLLGALDKLAEQPGGLKTDKALELSRQIDEAGRNVLLQKQRADELTQSQTKLAAESERVADAIRKIDFKQLDNAGQLQSLNADLIKIQEELRKVGVEASSPNEALEKAKNLTKENEEAVIKLANAWVQVIAAIGAVGAAQANLSAQLANFQQHLSVINAQAFGTRQEAFNAEWGQRYNTILKEREKIGADTSSQAINDQIFAEQKARERLQEWAAEDRAIGGVASGHQKITAFLREESTLLQGIRQQQQLVTGNPFLTINQKNAQLLALMQQEVGTLNGKIREGQGLLDGGTLDHATYEQVARAVQDATFKVDLLSQKAQTLNFSGGLKANLLDWVNSFGTAADQIGKAITGSIGTALDATANALTDVIFSTGNWRQTVLQAEKAIVGSLIKIGLQMIAQKVLGTILGNQATQEQTRNNAQTVATATPAAVAQSGASSGFNWVLAGIAAVAAIALIIGLLSGGFEKGGYTGAQAGIAGIVHGQEFVMPHDVVKHYGLPLMTAIYQRGIPPARANELISNWRYNPVTPRFGSFETGGAVAAITQAAAASNESSSPAAGNVEFHVWAVANLQEAIEGYNNSPQGQKAIIDLLNGNVYRIRKRS